jgi:hypothetical protein
MGVSGATYWPYYKIELYTVLLIMKNEYKMGLVL